MVLKLIMEDSVTGVILAGGKSSRIGQDKAFIEVGGVRIFDYVFKKCQDIFSEMIIVTNHPHLYGEYKAIIVTDEIPETGSLGGLYTGLLWANNYHIFCVACDMPFLRPEFIVHLTKKRNNYDAVVPRTKEGLEPLHAIYSKRCIEPIKKFLERREFKIDRLFPEVKVIYCEEKEIEQFDPSFTSFININTKRDLMKMQQMLQGNKWEEEKVKVC